MRPPSRFVDEQAHHVEIASTPKLNAPRTSQGASLSVAAQHLRSLTRSVDGSQAA